MKFVLALLFTLFALPASAADATLASATCPGSGCQTTTVTGLGAVAVQVNGTFSGILVFEGSVDGTNYVGVLLNSSTGAGAASTQATGMWSGNVTGAIYADITVSYR